MNPGDLIQSRYRLTRLLGSGASGSVWAAKNELIDRDVALKIMRPEVASNAVLLQRFFNEAKASGRVRSPSIVEILDLGLAEDGSPFLVFELLEGEGLDEKLAREGKIAPEELLELLIGVAHALHLAHGLGVIHRDLKPANLFITRTLAGTRVTKILDFGVSKVFDPKSSLTLTRSGTAVGSPMYMSPEQCAGSEDLDARSDVWALGVVMFEALTGGLPHDAVNYNALMVRVLTQDCDSVKSRRPELPDGIAAIVDACLKRKRDDRTSNAETLALQMEGTLREMRAVRLRALGRRATDKSLGDIQIRETDRKALRAVPALPYRRAVMFAGGVGLAVGVLLTTLVMLLFRR